MRHPRHICLVRGNHECRSVSGHFGFKEECVRKYGLPVYYRFLLCFQTMPIGALVHTEDGEKYRIEEARHYPETADAADGRGESSIVGATSSSSSGGASGPGDAAPMSKKPTGLSRSRDTGESR